MKPTKNGNIEAVFKPHNNSEPVTVFLHPSLWDLYFSPSSYSAHGGRLRGEGLAQKYKDHLKHLDELKFPQVKVFLLMEDTTYQTRVEEFGYDNNPSLVVRGGNVCEVTGRVSRVPHLENGDTYNHVCWRPSFDYSDSITASEKKALGEAFDEVLCAALPKMLPKLIDKMRKQATDAMKEFVREQREELKQIAAAIH